MGAVTLVGGFLLSSQFAAEAINFGALLGFMGVNLSVISHHPVIPCDEWTPAQVKAFRLMVNRSVTWADWDDVVTALTGMNFFVASDYVRIYTDIACMEAANEAARRAVNCLLLASGSKAAPAQLWPLQEAEFLKPIQEIDRIRFSLGLEHLLASSRQAASV